MPSGMIGPHFKWHLWASLGPCKQRISTGHAIMTASFPSTGANLPGGAIGKPFGLTSSGFLFAWVEIEANFPF